MPRHNGYELGGDIGDPLFRPAVINPILWLIYWNLKMLFQGDRQRCSDFLRGYFHGSMTPGIEP